MMAMPQFPIHQYLDILAEVIYYATLILNYSNYEKKKQF